MDLRILPVLLILIPPVAGAGCLSLYDYDSSMPPEFNQTIVGDEGALLEYRLDILSVNGEVVPTLLSIPRDAREPPPVVILLHGYGGDKEDLIEAAGPLAERGYAAASIDAQYHGERKKEGMNMYSADSNMTIDAFVQTVADVRRLIDHLETRDDVDASRIGLVGASMGALLGTIVAGVEDRIDVPILVVGGGNMSILLAESQLSKVIEIRELLEEEGRTVEEVAAELECIDPINFVANISPRPLLMINGLKDDIVPVASNRALYARAGRPKRIVWYDTGHDVPVDPAALKAFFWLEKHLKKRFYLQEWFYLLLAAAIICAFGVAWYRQRDQGESDGE